MNKQNEAPFLDRVIIKPEAPIAEAIERLDEAGTGALLLCSPGRKLCGLLTDGDIRRAVLQSKPFELPCSTIATRTPIVTTVGITPAEALRMMNRYDINHLPVLNAEGLVVDFLLRKNLMVEEEVAADTRRRLEQVLIASQTPVSEAIARLDKAGTGALVLCSEDRRLEGILTDGDIRRAILHHVSFDTPCLSIASRNPVTAPHGMSQDEILHLMNQHDIHHVPVIDANGAVTAFYLRKDIIGEDEITLPAVVMAGGFGKRLLPLTEQVPKPMLPVGDKPLLELTIEQLRRSGIREVNLTTHYLPENIIDHFGDGEAFGVKLNYSREDHPLGTAGGLRLMKRPERPFLVINGDILTGVPFQNMLAFHREHDAQITVGVRKYEVQVPFGVVESDDVRVTELKEKPSLTFFINAGIYILEPTAYDRIPEGRRFDMTELIHTLLQEGQTVVSFPIVEYWLDIGQPADYQKAQDDYKTGKI